MTLEKCWKCDEPFGDILPADNFVSCTSCGATGPSPDPEGVLWNLLARLHGATSERAQALPTAREWRDALLGLRRGDCWCECGIGNPMMGGKHSPQCESVRALIDRDEGGVAVPLSPVPPCDIPCSKCGSTDVERKYYAQDCMVCAISTDSCGHMARRGRQVGRVSGGHVRERNHVTLGIPTVDLFAERECIYHHCRSCQYEWTTDPLYKQEGGAA